MNDVVYSSGALEHQKKDMYNVGQIDNYDILENKNDLRDAEYVIHAPQFLFYFSEIAYTYNTFYQSNIVSDIYPHNYHSQFHAQNDNSLDFFY